MTVTNFTHIIFILSYNLVESKLLYGKNYKKIPVRVKDNKLSLFILFYFSFLFSFISYFRLRIRIIA